MIDFTDLPKKKKAYGGANGNKISVIFNNATYMLKLPSHALKNANLSYSNSAVSEYLGCHIYNLLGVESQETILGTYIHNGQRRTVVACKDFVNGNEQLFDFASVKNQIIDSLSNGYGTDIEDILKTIETQNVIDPYILKERFWMMFVIDALIGNWDRHNGNWGFLYKQEDDTLKLAPVYDCGSCLYPQIDEATIKKVLNSKQEQRARIYDIPTSAITQNGSRINYYKFLMSHAYKDCEKAKKLVSDRFDFEAISNLIDGIEVLSENHKTFLKLMIKMRFECLIQGSL
ncbi:MAG: HipA domain-containing protein [Bacilli bacterium]|nr:HipA domain-containing protein [Bacilli bacterium]